MALGLIGLDLADGTPGKNVHPTIGNEQTWQRQLDGPPYALRHPARSGHRQIFPLVWPALGDAVSPQQEATGKS